MDEAFAGVGMALPPRFKHMTEQEQPSQTKAVLQVLIRPAVTAAKVLTEAGFLTRTKRGTWAYYRLRPDALERVAQLLTSE